MAVVVHKCLRIGVFIPGYLTHFGCHGYKESEIFEHFYFFINDTLQ